MYAVPRHSRRTVAHSSRWQHADERELPVATTDDPDGQPVDLYLLCLHLLEDRAGYRPVTRHGQ